MLHANLQLLALLFQRVRYTVRTLCGCNAMLWALAPMIEERWYGVTEVVLRCSSVDTGVAKFVGLTNLLQTLYAAKMHRDMPFPYEKLHLGVKRQLLS